MTNKHTTALFCIWEATSSHRRMSSTVVMKWVWSKSMYKR